MSLGSLISADRPLVLVGAGKMGSAMLSGWLARGLDPSHVIVVDPAPPSGALRLLREAGIESVAEPPEQRTAGIVVLAVKPQVIGSAMTALRPMIDAQSLAVSIAAGVTLRKLGEGLGTTAVVRAMPNTPAQIGKGITVAVAGQGIDAERREGASALLGAVGGVEWVDDEGLMDAVTAVSGSGPAYVFLLAECLAEAGVETGLSPELARRLADATVSGAGALLEASVEDPAVLRKNVTSPGGTTAAALEVLTAPVGLSQLMRRAVAAAKKRSQELG